MKKENDQVDTFFIQYRDMVIRNVYVMVRDYYTAEDICQETFIRLGEHLDHVPPQKVKRWLINVSGRLAFDYLRKGGKCETKIGIDESELELLFQDDFDLSDLIEKKEECEQRGRVLKRLKKEKPLWYDVICMSYLEDMDNPAIGKELGVKPSLVSKWKERGKRWLKSAYEDAYTERGS